MRKKIALLGLISLMALGSTVTSFAGTWKLNATGWWWQNDNGTYPTSCWQWIDGNKDGVAECYYFNRAGYMFWNTMTPDGYQVNENGAWVINGVIQTKNVR